MVMAIHPPVKVLWLLGTFDVSCGFFVLFWWCITIANSCLVFFFFVVLVNPLFELIAYVESYLDLDTFIFDYFVWECAGIQITAKDKIVHMTLFGIFSIKWIFFSLFVMDSADTLDWNTSILELNIAKTIESFLFFIMEKNRPKSREAIWTLLTPVQKMKKYFIQRFKTSFKQ